MYKRQEYSRAGTRLGVPMEPQQLDSTQLGQFETSLLSDDSAGRVAMSGELLVIFQGLFREFILDFWRMRDFGA